MKSLMILLISVFSLSLFAKAPVVVEAPIEQIFVPEGFDNNDNIELVITGKFPNPCYTKNSHKVEVVGSLINISVSSLSKDDPNRSRCAPMKVPFTEVISVGSLQGGKYKIVVNKGGKFQKTESIKVSEASSRSVDENIYAIVEYVETGFTGGKDGSAFLVSKNPSPCLVLDRVEYLSNKKDVLSVLPIMKKISSECPEDPENLMIPIKFNPGKYSAKQVLIYVRTLEGGSVHSIIKR